MPLSRATAQWAYQPKPCQSLAAIAVKLMDTFWDVAKSCGPFQDQKRWTFSWGPSGVPIDSSQLPCIPHFAFLWGTPHLSISILGLRGFFWGNSHNHKQWGASAPSFGGCHHYHWDVLKAVKLVAASFNPWSKWRINQKRYWQSAVKHGDLLLQKVY